MLFLFIGKLFCIIIIYLISKGFCNYKENKNNLLEQFLSWFLIEYIPKYYRETINNCFSKKLEFRILIYNIVSVIKNLFIYLYLNTIIKYIVLFLLGLIIICIISYLFSRYKNKGDLGLIVILYYCYFLYIIFLDCLKIKNEWIINFIFYLLLLFILILNMSKTQYFILFSNNIKYVILKIYMYFIISIYLLIDINYIFSFNLEKNNFFLELCTFIYFIYFWFYYKILYLVY